MGNDREPPSDPFRRDSALDLERLLDNVGERQKKMVDAERRARERESRERSRRNEELQVGINKVSEQVSELFTRDAIDVAALRELEKDTKEMKADILTEIGALKQSNALLLAERNKTQGGIAMLKVMIPIVGAVTTAAVSFVTWLIQQGHHP